MRQADQDIRDLVLQQKVFARARHVDNRLTHIIPPYLEVSPLHLATPTGAERFEDRFLGCPAPGKVFHRACFALAVVNFMWRKDALEENIAMPVNDPRDTSAFDDVGAKAVDIHREIVTCSGL